MYVEQEALWEDVRVVKELALRSNVKTRGFDPHSSQINKKKGIYTCLHAAYLETLHQRMLSG
jgi:hypothetical protein